PRNLPRRPPPHPPLRGSITRPTCALSTLHDEGHPTAMQDSLPACWLGINWAGLAPAGFHSRISRDRLRPPFPSSQACLAHKFWAVAFYYDLYELFTFLSEGLHTDSCKSGHSI